MCITTSVTKYWGRCALPGRSQNLDSNCPGKGCLISKVCPYRAIVMARLSPRSSIASIDPLSTAYDYPGMVGKGTDLGASWPMTSASFFHPAATHQPCDFHWCFQPQAHRPGYWSFFSAGPGVFGKLSVILRKHSGYAEEYTHSCRNNYLVGIVGRLHFSKLGLHLARRPACSTFSSFR
jgi:hypothetical protein